MSKNCSNFDKSNTTSVTKTEYMICGFCWYNSKRLFVWIMNNYTRKITNQQIFVLSLKKVFLYNTHDRLFILKIEGI